MICCLKKNLCKYKHIFGVPGQGIHSYKIFNIAFIDLFFTLLFAYYISYIYSTSFLLISLLLLVLSYFVHKLFCVKTRGVILVDSILF